MTVSSLGLNRTQYDCNGSTVDFPFIFGVGASSEITVTLADSNNAETVLIETTHYTVTGLNDDLTSGGTVTTVLAYADGYTITISMDVPITQESDFTENMPSLYETFERGLDKQTRISQQLAEQISRAPKLAVSSTYAADEMTIPDPNPGRVIGWNAGGTDLTTFEISNGTPVAVTAVKLLSGYASFAAAVTDIGATETMLIKDADATLTTNVTVPKTLSVLSLPGWNFSGAYIVTFNGKFYGSDGCFAADITVAFGAGSVERVLPEWWGTAGDGVTDDFAKMQRCWNAADNIAPVFLLKTYLIEDQLEVPCGGFTLESTIGNSYFVSGGRSRYHLVNGIGADDTKSLIYADADTVGKGTITIRNMNINMADSTSSAISNEGSDNGSRFHLEKITVDNCGKHGFYLQNGANSTEIINCILIGISTASVDDGSGIVSGSYGIYCSASDIKIRGGEIKGKFDVGVVLTADRNVVSSMNMDQCNFGALDKGGYNRWSANRFQYNYTSGMDLGVTGTTHCISPTIVGNEFSRNNSTKSLETLAYDGSGILCSRLTGGSIIGNTFNSEDEGILIAFANYTTFGPNSEYDLDGELYDYSANTGTTDIAIYENSDDARKLAQYIVRGTSKLISHAITPLANGGYVETAIGTYGGSIRTFAVYATKAITAAASISMGFVIPSGAKMLLAAFRVDTALTTGETWDAEWNDGSTLQAIVTAGPVAKNTQRRAYFNVNGATDICDTDTDIVIKKNGGGSFTAAGSITCVAYYQYHSAMDTLA